MRDLRFIHYAAFNRLLRTDCSPLLLYEKILQRDTIAYKKYVVKGCLRVYR